MSVPHCGLYWTLPARFETTTTALRSTSRTHGASSVTARSTLAQVVLAPGLVALRGEDALDCGVESVLA